MIKYYNIFFEQIIYFFFIILIIFSSLFKVFKVSIISILYDRTFNVLSLSHKENSLLYHFIVIKVFSF